MWPYQYQIDNSDNLEHRFLAGSTLDMLHIFVVKGLHSLCYELKMPSRNKSQQMMDEVAQLSG